MKRACAVGICFTVMVLIAPAWGRDIVVDAQEGLAKKGVTVSLSEAADYATVYKGGLITKDTFVGLAEIGVTFDTEKMGLWKGGEFYVHGTNAQGHLKPSAEMVGDMQAVNNNEAPRTTRLYELWYQQHLAEDKIAVLVGIHDLDTDFMVSDYGGLYINGAFGVPTTLTANVAAPVYPLAAPAVRVKLKPVEDLELLAGIYDGNPGDPNINEHGTHYAMNSSNGLLSIGEADWHYKIPIQTDLPGVVKVGGWHHSADVDDVSSVDDNGDPIKHDDNYGGYMIIDQMIYRENEDQGLGIFVMASGAPQNRNSVERHFATGLNYTGLIPRRDKDVMGVALTDSTFSHKARIASDQERGETTIEGTYQIHVNDHMSVQPDIQYVMNPSGDRSIKNASVFTLRTEITF